MATVRELLIYGLVDPRTSEIRYVGKSTRGLHRPKVHTSPSVHAHDVTHKGRWITQLGALGLTPAIVVLEIAASVDELIELEKKWIAYGRANGWKLTNHTDGGEGTSGRIVSEQTRSLMRAKLSRHPALVAANKGKMLSPEHRAKIGAANTGRSPTAETRAKIGAANRGRPMPDQTRAALLAANMGSKRTPDSRVKMSAARRARAGTSLSAAEREQRVGAVRAAHSESAKVKRSITMRTIWNSPEARARRIEGMTKAARSESRRAASRAGALKRWHGEGGASSLPSDN